MTIKNEQRGVWGRRIDLKSTSYAYGGGKEDDEGGGGKEGGEVDTGGG